jgi:glycosyltransferase involved in cell wall biosynthesis
MRCPNLSDLPEPPSEKAGWPWTEDSLQLADSFHDNTLWPRLSVITPSLNQGDFIEETIRSILLQGYPNLEYIVIDGGSNDDSTKIIQKYEKWIDFWVSEPDAGQSDAINKGLRFVNGTWVTWINSDDLLAQNALAIIGQAAMQCNSNMIIAGDVVNFNYCLLNVDQVVCSQNINFNNVVKFWKNDCIWHQPGLFLPKKIIEEVGNLNINRHYAMDHDLLCRMLMLCDVFYLNHSIAYFRLHNNSKGITQRVKTLIEKIEIAKKYWHLTKEPQYSFLLNIGFFLVRFVLSSFKRKRWLDLWLMLKYLVFSTILTFKK